MTGTLGLFSLSDLFQLLSTSSRSGRLAIDHPRGPARVYFEKGQVVHAVFGRRTGFDAVYELFADEQGDFEFKPGLAAIERTIRMGTENVVLEAIRRLDEARRDQPVDSIPRSAVPVRAADAEPAVTLQPTEQRVLEQVDGVRNVTQIAVDASLEPEDVMRVVARLTKIGLLRIKARPPRTARLVTRLAARGVPTGHLGIDPGILRTWEKALGGRPTRVVAKCEDGRTIAFGVAAVEGAGPYAHLSRDTLLRADVGANATLLVRPVPDDGATGR